MTLIDARLREMQFLAKLDREGALEVLGPYDGSPERQMLISLVDQGYLNGIDSRGGPHSGPFFLLQAAADHRAETMWRLAHREPNIAKVTLQLSHRGRVRLSELLQQLKTGRDRDETGLLWAKRHLRTDLSIAVLSASVQTPLSVAFLDMNGLKAINDNYGHPAGDDAIRAFFQSALATLGQRGEVYRNGGDEVVAVLPGLADLGASELLARFVRQLSKDCLVLGDGKVELSLSASCGSASTTSPDEDGDALLKRADDAEIRAKNRSRDFNPRVSTISVGDDDVTVIMSGNTTTPAE